MNKAPAELEADELTVKSLYCCGCESRTDARLVGGEEIYPHRADLYSLPFWKCDKCNNFVGCHHKTKDRTRPLGCIATKEIKSARIQIHKTMDPIWRSGRITRKELYNLLKKATGRPFHTANIRSVEEAQSVYMLVIKIAGELGFKL